MEVEQNSHNEDLQRREYDLKLGELGEIDLWRENRVLDRYDALTGSQTREHGELTCRVLEDFLGTGIGQNFYSAAMLHRIALDVDDPQKGPAAAGLLRSYSETLPVDEWERISRYLSDLRPLVDFADAKRKEADALFPVKPPRSSRKGQPSERQKSRLGRVDALSMDSFLEGVNIETANIMAGATLAVLMRPGSIDDTEYHRVLREADIVYGQITDFSSKDAFTMALRNNKKRFTDSYPRHEWVYGEIAEYMDQFGGRDAFVRYVNGLLSRTHGADNLQEHAIKGNTEHGIVYGTAAVQTALGGITRIIYRKKSVEGAADKVMRMAERLGIRLKPGEGVPRELLPPDVLGLTFVENDIGALALVYSDVLGAVARDRQLIPGADPTKSSPHSLDGSPEFIKGFIKEFTGYSLLGDAGIATKPNGRGFDAIRTLVRYRINTESGPAELPVDMHFQTTAGRMATRTGTANHNAYDMDKTQKLKDPNVSPVKVSTDALVRLETRAKHMGSGIFVPDSYARANYWRSRIAGVDKVAIF
jgi:hypothetical protein